jgi:hypothetical protein
MGTGITDPALSNLRERRSLSSGLREEHGEVGAGTYLLALMVALWFMFFALDLGLRKGAQLSTEYAAFCAARAAAVHFNTYSGGKASCDADAAAQAALRAAAACMSGVVSKKGIPDPTSRGAVSLLVDRAQQQIRVTLSDGCSGKSDSVTAEVYYTHRLLIPLSPLSSGPVVMVARAQHLIY